MIAMAAIWYSDSIRPVPTYVLRAANRRTSTKFHQDRFITERLVYIEAVRQTNIRTDRRTWLYLLSSSPWSRIFLLYGVCEASFRL